MRLHFPALKAKSLFRTNSIWLFLLLAALSTTACRRDDDKDLLPPIGSSMQTPTTVESDSEIKFASGWYDVETGANGQTWRWMGKRGELRLRNQGANMKLQIRGWAPVELLAAVPTIRLILNGRELENFTAPAGRFAKEYLVPRENQGQEEFSTLVIESSITAKPPNDTRELGYSLTNVVWEPVKP